MADIGRAQGRGKKSPKKPAKKSSFRKKAPPYPTPPHLMMHYLIMMTNWTDLLLPTPLRSPSASQTSRPSSPVSSIAGDGKGPGEGHVVFSCI